MMNDLTLGLTAASQRLSLPLKYVNRHGLITGATGSGKTVTMQRMIEQLSAAGVPVFAADIKGDLSGVAVMADDTSKLADATRRLGLTFAADAFPVRFWDLFGLTGSPIRTTVHEMGPILLSRMLGLNDTQEGVLAIAFQHAFDEDERLMDIDDLRALLRNMVENRETLAQRYGHLTSAAINVIQRRLFALEAQGGAHLFGDPVLDIMDLLSLDEAGRGMINLVDADKLMAAPKLYATFLLWLLTELFRVLPEAGDLAKPKLVFFFDEAHLLFADAPDNLVEMIERLVRLVRSKGVGVYFVTQSPKDVPASVMAQLGNRVQHALRAYTPEHQKMVAASARAFRPPEGVKKRAWLETMEQAITQLAVGEALASVLTADGVPCEVMRIRVIPPSAQVGPITHARRAEIIAAEPLQASYERIPEREMSRRMFLHRIITLEGGDPLRYALPLDAPLPELTDGTEGLPTFSDAFATPVVSLRHRIGNIARNLVAFCFYGAVTLLLLRFLTKGII